MHPLHHEQVGAAGRLLPRPWWGLKGRGVLPIRARQGLLK